MEEFRQKDLLDRLVEHFEKQARILGIFLGGSLATGEADEFSDIDFRLLIAENLDKKLILNELVSWSDVFFVESFTDNYAVIHFER